MAVDTYEAFGAALIYVGTGTLGALELLGYTEQGVDLDISESKEELMTDLLGTKTPQDFQDMGMMALITAPMIVQDSAVMDKIIGRSDRTSLGQIATPGLVLGINSKAFSVAIVSGVGTLLYARPWYFFTCLMRRESARLATKANPFRLELIAWPYYPFTATSGKDAPLFRRSLT